MERADLSRVLRLGSRAVAVAGVSALGLVLTPAVHAVTPAGHGGSPAAVHHASNHHYVTSSLVLNTDPSSKKTGFDLTNDGQVDNQVAKIFAAMAAQGLDFPSVVQTSITSGQVVMLHSLHTTSLTKAKTATWQVFDGKPKAHPVLTGGGKFAVDPAAPSSSALSGSIKNGTFLGTSGTIPLQLALVAGQAPDQLKVIDAHLKAHCDASGCTHAKVGGAVTLKQVNHTIIPTLAAAMTALVAETCSAASPGTCSAQADQILSIFDTNNDYVISTQELKSNGIIKNVFAPDLDLFKANGKRGTDGTNDSLSIGLGFTAASAHFTQP